ncbi:MAG: ABC transporter ATP-binding protein, partial [Acetobacteraceae bacterium]|nr:ABC transporter ATP-binding protein [Acetobacteraceae bacterium]
MTCLEVNIEEKRFGTQTILRDIGFAARNGEIVALLGPSGAGKSTALRIVLGLDHDYWGGVEGLSGRVGAVFQQPALVPWLNVSDNIRLVHPEDVPIPALLDQVGLGRVESLFPAALSLGMARRVALARALSVSPSILVLDEPFASLHPQLAARLGGVVAQWARQMQATTLIAMHDLDHALSIADRVLVLSG